MWKLLAVESGSRSSATRRVTTAAVCHHRTRPTPSLQQYHHAGRSAVIAVSLLGRCAYRRKECLASESCCRSSTAARCSNIWTVWRLLLCSPPKTPTNENMRANGSSCSHSRTGYRCGPGVEGVRVCGGEHSSEESCLLSSVRWRSSELLSCTTAAAVCHRRTHATHLFHHNSKAPRRVVRSVSLPRRFA